MLKAKVSCKILCLEGRIMLKAKVSCFVVLVFLVSTFFVTFAHGETLKESGDGLPYSNLQIEARNVGGNNYVAEVTFTFPTSGYEIIYEDQVGFAGMVNPDGSTCMSIMAIVDKIVKPSGECLQVETKKTITYNLGELSPGIHKFTLKFNDGTPTVFKDLEIIKYENYLPTREQIDVRVSEYSKSETGSSNYKVLVQLTFPDNSYKVDYDNSLITNKIKNVDGTEYYSHIGTARIQKRNGAAATVMTTAKLEYDLKDLDPSASHQFVFSVDGIKCYRHILTPGKELVAIEEPVNESDSWSDYKPLMGQMEVDIGNDSKSNYTAYITLTYGSTGYRVLTEGEVGISKGVNPNGTILTTLNAIATPQRYNGPALTVITTELVKFNLGQLKPGQYQYVFADKVYKFEVPQQGGDKILYGDINDDGKVNSIDFAYYRCYLVRLAMPGEWSIRIPDVGDLDGNGVINSLDFGLLKKYLLGQIDKFPVQN